MEGKKAEGLLAQLQESTSAKSVREIAHLMTRNIVNGGSEIGTCLERAEDVLLTAALLDVWTNTSAKLFDNVEEADILKACFAYRERDQKLSEEPRVKRFVENKADNPAEVYYMLWEENPEDIKKQAFFMVTAALLDRHFDRHPATKKTEG